ncbi:benzoylformate decarboxylase [Burkholderia sp. SRS-W-2-2016]|uniref:benzoylformate decarboxylase n=1 Tax=Burkholderia sp. SRS-W-2-2016 TaxID=1926878 RepID=UPI00094B74B7|nr:benzoylformate decarboxylase [Burkholderia sp. SRS-W-2-2016]OLL32430.1 benzoylformate decarboxylase [Burkholderia sp. SRS-W-2-2016]
MTGSAPQQNQTQAVESRPQAGSPGNAPWTVRDAVIDFARRVGMTSIFANPGSTELPMFRDFPTDFRYVLGLQEAVVVGMADGYAQATGNAALINLHSAAGVGNAMGNIFTAFRNRTPLVVTAGQQARSILPYDPFLAATQASELPKPYVKWSIEPARAQDVPLAIARAYAIAMQEPRGPVFVSIPADDWDQPAERVAEREVSHVTRPDPAMLERIGALLDACERPAFVVGGAVDRADAADEVVRLAERHRARVYVAPMTGRCSFPETHRLFAGFLPAMRERIVELLGAHDAIFAIGAPAFTYHVEGNGPHVPPGAQLCQLIDDPAVASWTPQGLVAVGNVRFGVQDLLARAAPAERALPAPREVPPRALPPVAGERMSVAFALQTLTEVRDPDGIVVEEAPSSRPVMQRYLPIPRAGKFLTMDSGGLGYGMPAAVGVALARPGERVIALIGDGSSMYSIQAIWSAAQMRLPITFVILNNTRYAALQDFAPVFGFGPHEPVQGTDLPGLDFVTIAAGMGCPGVRVDAAAKLADALRDALAAGTLHNGPTLVEVVVA